MSTIKAGYVKNLLDKELIALEHVVSGADSLPYFTGDSTATVTVITSAGRAILDDINVAAQQATLGVRPGIDVEVHKTNLTAIGNLTSATDTLPYFTGAGTANTTSFTVAARNLLDDVDAAAMRTTLSAQTQNANLQAIADKTTAADKIIYYTGAGTGNTTPLTAQARTLLQATDAAGQRSAMGAANTGKAIAMAIVFGG